MVIYIHVQLHIIQSLKKGKESSAFVTTQMNLENSMFTEIRQAQKGKYCMVSHTGATIAEL